MTAAPSPNVHLGDLVVAYNFGRRLMRLLGLTPFDFICKA